MQTTICQVCLTIRHPVWYDLRFNPTQSTSLPPSPHPMNSGSVQRPIQAKLVLKASVWSRFENTYSHSRNLCEGWRALHLEWVFDLLTACFCDSEDSWLQKVNSYWYKSLLSIFRNRPSSMCPNSLFNKEDSQDIYGYTVIHNLLLILDSCISSLSSFLTHNFFS